MPAPAFVAPEVSSAHRGVFASAACSKLGQPGVLRGQGLLRGIGRVPTEAWSAPWGEPGRDQSAATAESPCSAEKSHIISHGHFSSTPQNVAIPTMQIQGMKKLEGNYVRNW